MRLALLGSGFMGGVHLAAMQQVSGVEVAAVASLARPAADAAVRGNLDLKSATMPASARWTPDWRDVFADPDIDAVDVCLPTHMHREVVLAALHAGKHVLCEKPMALTTDECNALVLTAQGSGLTFMVAQVLRFMAPYRHAAEFVSKHRAAMQSATLQRSTGFPGWGGWLGDAAKSGGAILDLLSHDLDQALALFGHPESVHTESLGEVDTARCTLRYADGLNVVVEGGWFAPEVQFSCSFNLCAVEHSLTFRDGVLREGEQAIELPEQDAYLDEIAYFVECCRTGRQPDRCPPAASADAVRVSNLLRLSRDEGGREVPWQA